MFLTCMAFWAAAQVGALDPGPPRFQQLGVFLTPSNHSWDREELNVQGLPEESEGTDGNRVLPTTTEPRNDTREYGN